MPNDIARRDGSLDFSGGVNSLAVTTLRSERAPSGLKRNELAWINNGTVRDGGITTRPGIVKVGTVITNTATLPNGVGKLFQGKFPYTPFNGDPYEIWSVSGNILRVNVDTAETINLSQQFNLYNNPTEPFAFFVQAEEFMVIQSGDNATLPLFWDGSTLRRSNGSQAPLADSVYTFVYSATWKIPAVGATVVVPLTSPNPYPGAINDQGTLSTIGVFKVTAIGATDVTLQTISSAYIGANISGQSTFTVNANDANNLVNELPAATAMDYYMGRIWYAIGTKIAAGDVVFGSSGTQAYGFRDSILKVTENPLAIVGDGFAVPTQDGNIRFIKAGGAIDAALGQGRLFIGTTKAIYALQVPVSRQNWIDAGFDNQPLMTVVQKTYGSVNDRSVVVVNGDLFYQSLEPGIRSLMQSVRLFNQWGNTKLSANEQRILQFNNRSLLRGASGIFFDNRLLETSLPRQTEFGIVHDAVIPLDVMPISTFNQQVPPNWEGSWQGIGVMQMNTLDFGGRERAFCAVLSSEDSSLQLWEITTANRQDFSVISSDGHRIQWQVELPAFTWSDSIGELELKKLVGGEIWYDRLWGEVIITVEYRPDGATCWIPWAEWKDCVPKNTNETIGLPSDYPIDLGECWKMWSLPKPDPKCAPCDIGRPADNGIQFQPRITVKGFFRLRGFWMWAEPVERPLYYKMIPC